MAKRLSREELRQIIIKGRSNKSQALVVPAEIPVGRGANATEEPPAKKLKRSNPEAEEALDAAAKQPEDIKEAVRQALEGARLEAAREAEEQQTAWEAKEQEALEAADAKQKQAVQEAEAAVAVKHQKALDAAAAKHQKALDAAAAKYQEAVQKAAEQQTAWEAKETVWNAKEQEQQARRAEIELIVAHASGLKDSPHAKHVADAFMACKKDTENVTVVEERSRLLGELVSHLVEEFSKPKEELEEE